MSVSAFLAKELSDCDARDIAVVLSPTSTISIGSLQTMGWFDETSLNVAIDRPLVDWLSTFVHESCHKDQFVEKSPAWDTKIGQHDTCDVLDMWLENVVELTPEQLQAVIDKVQRVELDCERRSVRKILADNLPIDVELYTKKANAYVWFYLALQKTRKWITAPYNDPRVLALMPTHFDNDYTVMPAGFFELIETMS